MLRSPQLVRLPFGTSVSLEIFQNKEKEGGKLLEPVEGLTGVIYIERERERECITKSKHVF